MMSRSTGCPPIFIFLSLLFLLPIIPVSRVAEAADQWFFALQKQLVSDGFDDQRISRLYSSGSVDFDAKGVSLFFLHNESKLNYDQFLSPEYIQKTRQYLSTHERIFLETEKNFGVEKEIIAAIILIETRLGQYLGNRSVLTTLSTLASLENPRPRAYLWNTLSKNRKISRKHFEKKADRRSVWAYQELTAFLTYAFRENLDPFSTVGSYAGAMGICQFMPSNILLHGEDGDLDGRIDPYTHADAIASIGAYLKHYGWFPGIEGEKAYQAIWYYNKSNYYVNTVLKVAELVKG